ncbi:MAG TPA: glucose-6-phosphate dehydrogenase [Patescibacteria group bacterium]|nr:glucose-6-phosphate dehydrogenase [Patescibacteria group bacterium]
MLDLPPAILTIFGITGDLAKRKLLPALYFLANDNLLPPSVKIIGVTRRGTTVSQVIENIRSAVELEGETPNPSTMKHIEQSISIIKMDITDPAEYVRLKVELDKVEDELGVCLNRLFYLAIPSQMFTPVVRQLGTSRLNSGCQHGTSESRLLVEKPFGYDLESAEELIEIISGSFPEKQVYRIDHYLAKETVQNILTFRFQNPLFESDWDNKHIGQIMITAAETIGIEGRVVFYEQMGALRDLVQSHLLQLLSLVTMERPKDFSAEAIHSAKLALLDAIPAPSPDVITKETVRGQYDGYKEEVNNPESSVETFAALKLQIDNDRWRNVPIVLSTGKKLAEKSTEICIVFEDKAHPGQRNYLTIRIQPKEGITLSIRVKKPGFDDHVQEVPMDFFYGNQLQAGHPDAYERVVVDVLRGDKTLFATKQEILSSWRIITPILEAWNADRVPLSTYLAGSNGPASATKMSQAINL